MALNQRLNDEQSVIKDYVENRISNNKLCSILIQGVAGTGKSFLIKHLVELCKKFNLKTIIGSHQAIAASLVNGFTLCKIFGIYDNRNTGRILVNGVYNNLKKKNNRYVVTYRQKGYSFQEELNFNKEPEKNLLIIDEISMVGLEFLDDMDEILQVVFNSSKPFGGIHLIFCGHFAQLKPVNSTPIFKLKNDHFVKHMKLFELTINQRQQNQEFFDICNGVMKGYLTKKQEEVLKSRLVTNFDQKIFKDLLHIFPTKQLCNEHNLKSLLNLDTDVYYFLKAEDTGNANIITSGERKYFNGLSNFIIFSNNSKIMITSNGFGFLNGEIYKIEHVVLNKNISMKEFLEDIDKFDRIHVATTINSILKKKCKIFYCLPNDVDIYVDASSKINYSSKLNDASSKTTTKIIPDLDVVLDTTPSTSNASKHNKQYFKTFEHSDIEEDFDFEKPIRVSNNTIIKNGKPLRKIMPQSKAVLFTEINEVTNEKELKEKFRRTIQPFQLSWAVTTHKSQGMSLSEGIVDMGDSNFDPVQLYVGISRIRCIDRLYIRDLKLPIPVSPHKNEIKEFIESIKKNNEEEEKIERDIKKRIEYLKISSNKICLNNNNVDLKNSSNKNSGNTNSLNKNSNNKNYFSDSDDDLNQSDFNIFL